MKGVTEETSDGWNPEKKKKAVFFYFTAAAKQQTDLKECVHVSTLFQLNLGRLPYCLSHLQERPNKIAVKIT